MLTTTAVPTNAMCILCTQFYPICAQANIGNLSNGKPLKGVAGGTSSERRERGEEEEEEEEDEDKKKS